MPEPASGDSWREAFGRLFDERESLYRSLKDFPFPEGRRNVGAGLGFAGWPESFPWLGVAPYFDWGLRMRLYWESASRSFLQQFPPCLKVFIDRESRPSENARELGSSIARHLGVEKTVEVNAVGPVFASATAVGPHVKLAVANGASPTAWGTAGALVRRGEKEDFLISSAHVVSDVRGRGDDRVCTVDPQTGTAPSVVGRCKESKLKIGGVNQIDAALVELDQGANFPARRYNKAADIVVDPDMASRVQKVGARTGHTLGVVTAGFGSIDNIQYPGIGTADFREVFTVFGFSSVFPDFAFSDLGDSGAIVEDMAGQTALGMIVANMTNPNYGTVVGRALALESEFSIKFQ